jgi:hypothetical protein
MMLGVSTMSWLAGFSVSRRIDLEPLLDLVERPPRRLGDLGQPILREVIQVPLNQPASDRSRRVLGDWGPSLAGIDRVELQAQAFFGRARRQPRGLEPLLQ